jgi:hypothetical protein
MLSIKRAMALVGLLLPLLLVGCNQTFSKIANDTQLIGVLKKTFPDDNVIPVLSTKNTFLRLDTSGQPVGFVEFSVAKEAATTPPLNIAQSLTFSDCDGIVRRDMNTVVSTLDGGVEAICPLYFNAGALYRFNNGDVRLIEFSAPRQGGQTHYSQDDIDVDLPIWIKN